MQYFSGLLLFLHLGKAPTSIISKGKLVKKFETKNHMRNILVSHHVLDTNYPTLIKLRLNDDINDLGFPIRFTFLSLDIFLYLHFYL